MRKRYDATGNYIGAHNVIFDGISDNAFLDQAYFDMWGINSKEEIYFYYDESNNCRKFWLDYEKTDFNHNPDADFVLAGVASEKELDLSFDEIRDKFKLQKNMNELKSKSFFRGKDFLNCIGMKPVTALFSLINEYDLFIHYVHINNFFYTIVEILDSITNPEEIASFGFDYFKLKSTLFDMLHPKIGKVSEIMIKYAYPNIKTDNISGFCLDLCNLLGPKYEMKPEEKYIWGVLRRAAEKDKLLFIQDNEDYLLQEDYAFFYVDRIMLFPKSNHCFDEELSIQNEVERLIKEYGKGKAVNYCFVNSTKNCMVQISDLVAGLLGKMFLFFNTVETKDFRKIVCALSDMQIENLCELQRLRMKSDLRNKGFLHNITALDMLDKENKFFNLAFSEQKKRNIKE